MKRIGFFILFLPVFCVTAYCQDPAEKIRKSFANSQRQFPQVKPFAFFNQKKYVPGDTAFFKTYFFTEQLARVAGRQILHLSLINSTGKEVGHSNFGIKDGVGHSQFVLPDSLSAGFYRFTVYNNWMKNFSPSLFFQQEVEIIKKNKIVRIPNAESKLMFFPEGGALVGGVSNKIIIQAPGFSQASGEVVDNKGNIVTSFQINHAGFGLVIFMPQPEVKYTARINDQKFDLPPAQNDGLALLLTPQADRGPVRLLLTAPANSAYRKQELTLMLTMRGEVYYSAIVSLADKEFVQVMIPQTELPAGVAQLSILNNAGKEVSSRLFAVKGVENVKVTLKAKSPEFGTREKISVDVTLADARGNPLAGEFSVAVVNDKLFGPDSVMNFADHLTIFSELGSADVPFDKTHPYEFSTLDQWLITQKWRRFDWSKMMSPSVTRAEFQMNTLLNKKGRAFHLKTGQPVADSTLIIMYLQKHMIGYETYTEPNGQFELPFLFDFWGTDEIFYLAEQKGEEKSDIRVEWLPDGITAAPAHLSGIAQEEDRYSVFAKGKKLIDNSYHFYSKAPEVKPEVADPNAEFEDEVMGADVTVNVQDYILFPTMIEVIREIIPSLQHRKTGGKTTVRVFLSEPSVFTTGDPLYVIDGIMTKDTEFFLSLNPSDIVTLKIVKDISKLRRFGAMGKNGMVLVQTKKLNLQKLRSGSTTLAVVGLERPTEFKTQSHQNDEEVRIPDFRSTLYWAPSTKVETSGVSNFSFFASDDSGPVTIKILGMTTDGRPFSAFTRVQINYRAVANQK